MGKDNSARGIALVELAITLTLIITLIAGTVDLWKLVRESDLILTASRHGARAAGAMAHQVSANGDLPRACDDVGGTSAVLNSAVSLAYNYLVGTGLESGTCTPAGSPVRSCVGASFTVSSRFETICEGGFAQRAVRLSVTASAEPRCTICFRRMFAEVRPRASSLFAVEAECSALGPLVCP